MLPEKLFVGPDMLYCGLPERDVQVRASQAKLDQAKVDYEKMQEAGRKNAAAPEIS